MSEIDASRSIGKGEGARSGTKNLSILETHGYKVGRVLGHGSYATVKEAFSAHHQCSVAVKVISKRKAPSDYLQKFLPREMKIVKMLKHRNLVLFLQSIETNSRVYIVMENATGGDLLEVIRERKFIPEAQAGLWFGHMLEAIDYCHKQGVVHRDLKCENVLLDESQNLKITDFGFARTVTTPGDEDGKSELSTTYCGSYAYAAPEILTGTPYVPQQSDVWSMGVILYVMVFGRLPFDDSNHKRLLKQVQVGPEFPGRSPVSIDCRTLIKKMLTKAVEQRITISQIRDHPWFKKMTMLPMQSKTDEGQPSTSKCGNKDKASFFAKLLKTNKTKSIPNATG